MSRPSKPTMLKIIGGNAGKRALNAHEPDPEYLNDLTAPEHLKPSVARVWDELAPKLRRAKLLTELDTVALEQLCVAIAIYRTAATNVLETSALHTYEKEEGESTLGLNPWMLVKSMTFKQSNAIMRDFGMTPAARSRVMVQPQDDLFGNDKLGAYMKQGHQAA